jgi:hypothetical protein
MSVPRSDGIQSPNCRLVRFYTSNRHPDTKILCEEDLRYSGGETDPFQRIETTTPKCIYFTVRYRIDQGLPIDHIFLYVTYVVLFFCTITAIRS